MAENEKILVYYRVKSGTVIDCSFNNEDEALAFYSTLNNVFFKCIRCSKYVKYEEVFDNG